MTDPDDDQPHIEELLARRVIRKVGVHQMNRDPPPPSTTNARYAAATAPKPRIEARAARRPCRDPRNRAAAMLPKTSHESNPHPRCAALSPAPPEYCPT